MTMHKNTLTHKHLNVNSTRTINARTTPMATRVLGVGTAILSVALAGSSIALAAAAQEPTTPGGPPSRPRQPQVQTQQPQTPDAQDIASGRHGYIAAPPGTENLATTIPENSLQLFKDENFAGGEHTISPLTTAHKAGGLNELPEDLNDSLTSLRWNLAPGVAVVLYEDVQGKGEQMILWGAGQMPSLAKWDFDNKASRFAWYDVGGGSINTGSAEAMIPPYGSQPLNTTLPVNTLQLFIDKNFENDMQQVTPVTAQKHGELHPMPAALGDSLTSMRWSLPEGVIVLLYQDVGGKKQQVGIWGQGQIADLDEWDFNDKVSRWSWAYIGRPETESTHTPR